MSGELQFYLAAVPAAILFGLSKGGFSSLSSLGMPMLSLVASPVRAAAIVLPILIVQDWLVRRVSPDRFYALILALTFLIGVKLTYDAASALV
jgi:hypothetical protein